MKVWTPRNEAEEAAADRARKFIRHLRHTKGIWAGVPFELLPWQWDEVVAPIFGTLDEDGARVIRQAYIEVGKKNGKSELAAAIALCLLFADSEPFGEVYGAAVDKDQAAIVFNVAAQMVRQSKVLSKRAKVVDSSKRIIITSGRSAGSVYRAIPADAAGADGFNVSAVIFDEIHRYPNRELFDTLVRSTASRRQPLVFGITTAGYSRESLCWSLHEYARQVIEGVIDDPHFLAVMYAASPEADFKVEASWRTANPSYGVTVPADYYVREAKKAAEDPTQENSFRRFHLNQWVAQETRWMPLDRWDASAGIVDRGQLARRPCFAGLDLANTSDLAACVLVFPPLEPSDVGAYRVLPHFWLPEEGLVDRIRRDRVPYDLWARDGLVTLTPGNVIDYETIRSDVQRLGMQYAVIEIAADPFNAWQLMQDLDRAGFAMLPIRQGFATLGPPTKELMRLVLEGQLHHGANPVLRWMVDSTAVEQDSNGMWKPSKRKSTQKIDGVVAMVMALDRAMRHGSEDSGDRVLVYDDHVQIGPNI